MQQNCRLVFACGFLNGHPARTAPSDARKHESSVRQGHKRRPALMSPHPAIAVLSQTHTSYNIRADYTTTLQPETRLTLVAIHILCGTRATCHTPPWRPNNRFILAQRRGHVKERLCMEGYLYGTLRRGRRRQVPGYGFGGLYFGEKPATWDGGCGGNPGWILHVHVLFAWSGVAIWANWAFLAELPGD